MRVFFKRSTPMRDLILFILFFGLLVPAQFAIAGDCNYTCTESGCSASGSFDTGQGGCMTTSTRECEEDPKTLVVKCKTITTCETITGACGDFGPPEL